MNLRSLFVVKQSSQSHLTQVCVHLPVVAMTTTTMTTTNMTTTTMTTITNTMTTTTPTTATVDNTVSETAVCVVLKLCLKLVDLIN